MKIVTFDVSNGACALAVCPNGYSMMIDCGSHSDKPCPVDQINAMRRSGYLSGMKSWTKGSKSYPLTLLHITHPDLDHVKNAQAVKEKLTPYLLHRTHIEKFPAEEQAATDQYYKDHMCGYYRGSDPDSIPWGFDESYTIHIPMEDILRSEILRPKLRNNASKLRLLGYKGFRILFGGDMETEGWEWLLANDAKFKEEIGKGVTVLYASHHGHKSGFSSALFSAMGAPKLSILSKGSEEDGETDVSSRYSELSEGAIVNEIGKTGTKIRKAISTRANGNIFIEVLENGDWSAHVEKGL